MAGDVRPDNEFGVDGGGEGFGGRGGLKPSPLQVVPSEGPLGPPSDGVSRSEGSRVLAGRGKELVWEG